MLTNLFLRFAYAGSEWVMWVLVLLSFVSVALMVDRTLFFQRNKIDLDDLITQLRQHLKDGNLRAAWALVAERPQIECQVVAEGLRSIQRGSDACAEAMLSAKSRERGRIDAHLNILATIGSNAPFVGLLGTVLGIIKAARDLEASSGAAGGAVMSGVFEALVATAVGLFVAIPAIIAYNVFQKKVKKTMGQVDTLSHLVLANIRPEWNQGTPQAAQSAAPGTQPPAMASR
jgi:biopolymer transport protein ExbB/TolQ